MRPTSRAAVPALPSATTRSHARVTRSTGTSSSGSRARAARRGAARRVLQERRVLRDVRAEVLLDAHHARDRAVAGKARAAEAGEAGDRGGGLVSVALDVGLSLR